MNNKDPLESLLVDADQIDRNKLATSLSNLIGVDKETGRISFKASYNDLTSKNQVLTYLLAIKVANLLERKEVDRVANKEIVEETGLPKGTVAPKLKELKDGRLISQDENSKYYVAHHQINSAIDEIKK